MHRKQHGKSGSWSWHCPTPCAACRMGQQSSSPRGQGAVGRKRWRPDRERGGQPGCGSGLQGKARVWKAVGLIFPIRVPGQSPKFPLNLLGWQEEGRTLGGLGAPHTRRSPEARSPKSANCRSVHYNLTHKPLGWGEEGGNWLPGRSLCRARATVPPGQAGAGAAMAVRPYPGKPLAGAGADRGPRVWALRPWRSPSGPERPCPRGDPCPRGMMTPAARAPRTPSGSRGRVQATAIFWVLFRFVVLYCLSFSL